MALGEIRAGSGLHRLTRHLMTGAYRSCDTLIALDPDMAAALALHGPKAELQVQAPWPEAIQAPPEPPATGRRPEFVWLYSGNLGRAHEWRTLLDAQKQLELEGEDLEIEVNLIFQGGGAERAPAMAYAAQIGLSRCSWQPYVDDEQLPATLLNADCLIATQKPETLGFLWPSKLALAVHLHRPILWIGPADAAVARQLAAQGHHCFQQGESTAVAQVIRHLAQQKSRTASSSDADSIKAGDESIVASVEKVRQEGIEHVVEMVEEVGGGS